MGAEGAKPPPPKIFGKTINNSIPQEIKIKRKNYIAPVGVLKLLQLLRVMHLTESSYVYNRCVHTSHALAHQPQALTSRKLSTLSWCGMYIGLPVIYYSCNIQLRRPTSVHACTSPGRCRLLSQISLYSDNRNFICSSYRHQLWQV